MVAVAGALMSAMKRTLEPCVYVNASGLDCEPSGLPTSTVRAPPGLAKGPPPNGPAMSGAAGLEVVSVWTLPQSQFAGGPNACVSAACALRSAVTS